MFGAELRTLHSIENRWRDGFAAADLRPLAFDGLDAAVCVVDRSLRVVAANRAWDALARGLGRSELRAGRLVGQRLLERLPAEVGDRWTDMCLRLLDGEEASYWNEFEFTAGQDSRWIRLTARALTGELGIVIGISFMLVDITDERRTATESLKRQIELRGLSEVAQSVGMISDASELLRRITGHLGYLFGARICAIAMPDEGSQTIAVRAPAHGLEDDEAADFVVPPEWIAEVDAVLARPAAAYLLQDDLAEAANAGGELSGRWQLGSLLIAPLRNQGRVLGYLILAGDGGCFDDEAGRLLATFAGLIAPAIDANMLVLALKDRADRLSAALAEIQEHDRFKDQLIQNVSHELRLPLMVIQGYADLLKEGALGALGSNLGQAVDVISQKAALLGKRVSDMVLSRGLRSAELDLEPVSLPDVVGAAIERAQARAAAAGVVLVGEAAPEVRPIVADRQLIDQVVDELLGNAVKFSPNGGEVRIAVREGGEVVYLKVSDRGIGIPAADVDRIWDRFYQSDGSTTRRFGGTGMGLAAVKQIVGALGGQVWAESREGSGSHFYVALSRVGAAHAHGRGTERV